MNGRAAAFRDSQAQPRRPGMDMLHAAEPLVSPVRWARRADSIRRIVSGRVAGGETLDAVAEDARLSNTERRVLELYVMGGGMTEEEVGCAIARSAVTVSIALAAMQNKLLGRHPRAHQRAPYDAMDDRGLEHAMRKNGAGSRTQLQNSNHALHAVCSERGILDRRYPPKRSGVLAEIRMEVCRQQESRPLDGILAPLRQVEREIITCRALPETQEGSPGFRKRHGVESHSCLEGLQATLLRKLKGLPTKGNPGGLSALRSAINALGEKKMPLAREGLGVRMLEILDRRAYAENPVPLEALACEWDVSRERARQLESKLTNKLRRMAH